MNHVPLSTKTVVVLSIPRTSFSPITARTKCPQIISCTFPAGANRFDMINVQLNHRISGRTAPAKRASEIVPFHHGKSKSVSYVFPVNSFFKGIALFRMVEVFLTPAKAWVDLQSCRANCGIPTPPACKKRLIAKAPMRDVFTL